MQVKMVKWFYIIANKYVIESIIESYLLILSAKKPSIET